MSYMKNRVLWWDTLCLIVCWVLSPLIVTAIVLWEARGYFKMAYQELWDATVEVKYEWEIWYMKCRL